MGETEDNFKAMKDASGMSEEEQRQYVSDVGDTGLLLQEASSELLKLLPLMWTGKLQTMEALSIIAALRSSMEEGSSNVDILEAYLRLWVQSARKSKKLSLVEARTSVLQERAEGIVGALTFDDDVKFSYTTSETFPEGNAEEQRRWVIRISTQFESALQGFVKREGVQDGN